MIQAVIPILDAPMIVNPHAGMSIMLVRPHVLVAMGKMDAAVEIGVEASQTHSY